MSTTPHLANARARANIALAKYWGKVDAERNLPAVPSISMTLDPLITETSVEFRSDLLQDELLLNGERALERRHPDALPVGDPGGADRGVELTVEK